MAEKLTISQLNKIGERLRKNLASADDLRLLDAFILSFTPAYEHVFDELTRLGLNPGGREHKTTLSIIAKLNRERTRLSRMQDIAGCRVVVDSLIEQNHVVDALKTRFPGAFVQDRRIRPRYGYRAVHLIVEIDDGYRVEIQVRTSLQHSWASATEKLSDAIDPDIKYGGGPERMRRVLYHLSATIEKFESAEIRYLRLRPRVSAERLHHVQEMEKEIQRMKAELKDTCEALIIDIRENGQ